MVQHALASFAVSLAFLLLGGQYNYNSGGNLQHAEEDHSSLRLFSRHSRLQQPGRSESNRRHTKSSLRSEFVCEVDNDLIMVLDSSAGMKEEDFKKAKVFFADFADKFNSHKQNRLGFKVFAVQPQSIFELTNIHSPSEMRKHIETAPYFGKAQKDAYFHYALLDSYSEHKRLNRSIVDQNFVLITAGPSKEASSISAEAAKMIKAGVRNFAVGIGGKVVESQLLAVTGNVEENVLLAPDFDGLKGILDNLTQLVCSDKAPVCHKENDLMVTLDDSGSVNPRDFQIGKDFVAKLFDSFVMHNENRVSFRIFSSSDKSIFKLNNTLTRAQVQTAVLGTAYRSGSSTMTDLTLDAGVAEFKGIGRGVPKNFLVITDGRSSYPSRTEAAAKRAHAAGINTFAVGIGSVSQSELLIIANGDPNRVFKVENFEELEEILKELSAEICT